MGGLSFCADYIAARLVAIGTSRHVASPRAFGRKRGMAEVDAQWPVAEGDAIDPQRTKLDFGRGSFVR